MRRNSGPEEHFAG
jgi:hypothetical protein